MRCGRRDARREEGFEGRRRKEGCEAGGGMRGGRRGSRVGEGGMRGKDKGGRVQY